jgi:aerobic-type carbon monoxide dehydrogenase small subunit (CoxS/CutS family)
VTLPSLNEEWPLVDYEMVVNGARQPVAEAWIGENLLFVLRERLGLMAAKDGCGEGECGACTVLLDGEAVTACLVPAVAAAGRAVQTPESFALPQPDAVAAALAAHAGAGCGFCLPGIGMELRALLSRNAKPSPAVVREALGGHRCRCLAPDRFVAAATAASAALRPADPAEADPAGNPGNPGYAADPGNAGHPVSAEEPAIAEEQGGTGEYPMPGPYSADPYPPSPESSADQNLYASQAITLPLPNPAQAPGRDPRNRP